MHRLERHGAFTAPVCPSCGVRAVMETVYLELLSLEEEWALACSCVGLRRQLKKL